MTASERSPTDWVQLLQALVARELVEELGVTATRAARMLGLAPSAISQYLSGRRVKGLFLEYSTDPEARRIAREVAERLAQAPAGGEARVRTLLDGAGALAEVAGAAGTSEGRGREQEAGPGTPPRSTAKWLRQRVRAEQAAVTMCMRLAQKARDELTRAILRQIASDSLRHAEIVASLAPYLDRGITRAQTSGITRGEVASLIAGERRAEAGADTVHARDLGGTMSLLIASMEADERKHAELLQGLLDSGFGP
jgi:predicted transcriptional regulator